VNTRDRILDAAAESFLEQGYRNSRMLAIAKRAGISRAALYQHFSTKEAVLLALNERVIDDARSNGLALLREALPAAERISNWLRDSLLSQWRHHAVRVVTIEETQELLLTDSGATLCIIEEVASALESAVRAGVKAGELRADLKPAQVAYALQSVLLGLHRNNVSRRSLLAMQDEAHITTTINLLVGGLLA
jgi:AcrR family transcriptional regulator